MKCCECKNCVNFEDGYYWCMINGTIEPIEECVANDENMGCEFYVEDLDDNETSRSAA